MSRILQKVGLGLAALLLLASCNRSVEPIQLTVRGEVQTTPSGDPVPGADWRLYERAVLDGALQAEQQVAVATSDEGGLFDVDFERRSSFSLRWTAEAPLHFTTGGELDPDALLPNAPFDLAVDLPAVCTLHVSLSSVPPQEATDQMAFHLGEDFPCACCPTDQVVLEGIDADSSWQCLMHGDRWMTWGADLTVALIGQPQGFSTDSVFCPAFGSAAIDLVW